MEQTHKWQYCSLGGVVRVKISSGEDIAHLGELDEKYWTVLSCPVDGLDIDKQTLAYLDQDGDGKIKVKEVVENAKWLCASVKDNNSLLKGESSINLDEFDDTNPLGANLKKSAKQILENLGHSDNVISLAEASDSGAIFKGTSFNGDGVITVLSAGDNEAVKATIQDCMATVGSVEDRSGEQGVTADSIDRFYALCKDYADWHAAAEADKANVFPYGAATPAAYQACCDLKEKFADYFTRCKLLNYDEAAAISLEVKVTSMDELATCPISRPCADCRLSLKELNPAWESKVAALLAVVPEKDFAEKSGITEKSWKEFCARFDAYAAWLGAKKGAEVERLGLERVKTILAEDLHKDLLNLIMEDVMRQEESNSIDKVKRFMYLYRDFGRFLRNYVLFTDFYDRGHRRAMFEAGRLFIDQRCCDLCIRVTDMAGHNDMAKLSGMFLIYCRCTSKIRPETLDIVAVLTAGDTGDLRPGKNGIFYDLQGRDWDATITKVVDNPISISNAFWAPYRKFWAFCVGLISKSAEEQDSKVMKEMQDKAAQSLQAQAAAAKSGSSSAAVKTAPFDIAKFAGIFAALGLALGYIGSFITGLAEGISRSTWWELLLAVVAIIILISGPSCFVACGKLRKRNLGPVLNANGWAMNTAVLVNIVFGNRLTSVATYPKLNIPDPNSTKGDKLNWFTTILLSTILLVAAMWFIIIRPTLHVKLQRAEIVVPAEALKSPTETTTPHDTAIIAPVAAPAPADTTTAPATDAATPAN